MSEVTERNIRLKNSRSSNVGDIPIDIVMEICSRLPTKSVARFSCVSKPWASLLCLPSFTELYLTRSLDRPRILFACHNRIDKEVLFFSSTPQQPYENLSIMTVTYLMKIPCNFDFETMGPIYLRGLVFLRDRWMFEESEYKVSMMCNSSTRQYLTLPKPKTRKRVGVRSYFGYDPVEKQYKVLSMTSRSWKGVFKDHQVMTLGAERMLWRRIECCVPHSRWYNSTQVCINGVLYYTAVKSGDFIIVCFDVKSEKFSFINYMIKIDVEDQLAGSALINCNGKLGSLMSEEYNDFVRPESTSITLWVLEDVEKQEWLKHTYVLPSSWKDIVGGGDQYLRFVGVTKTKEIVLSTYYPQDMPFYIFFYNTERGRITRVGLGMEGSEEMEWEIYSYLDHVEDVKLLQNVLTTKKDIV